MVISAGIQGLAVRLLNQFIGEYIENLDYDQLKVAVFSGFVELNNVKLKMSALDDMDLPVQLTYGHLGKLTISIPWKNVFGGEYVIHVEDVYLMVAPNQQIKYNAEKDYKKFQEARYNEIKKFEEAIKKELQKTADKSKDTFVEKAVSQAIRSIQIFIKNIHIRYEDRVTRPENPFAAGATLDYLEIVSTDENWVKAIVSGNVSKIFKILQLDALAVYWNSGAELHENVAGVQLINELRKGIATRTTKPNNYSYVLGPINASMRLRINQKPASDPEPFTIPKVHLNVDMETLSIGITKEQYRDLMALAESMGRMSKGEKYRKYRPFHTAYKGHYKEWWKFAYTCVMEEEVKRKKRNWDWNHMKEYREMCKEYKEYRIKCVDNATTPEEEARARIIETKLDITNIFLIIRLVELENRRIEKTVGKTESSGWFGWLKGSSGRTKREIRDAEGKDILQQFKEAMTPEEKEEMLKVIGYQDSEPSNLPETFVDNTCTFLLHNLQIEMRDEEDPVARVLFSELKGVRCRVDTRLSANAFMMRVKIDELTTYGRQQDDFIPKLVTSDRGQAAKGLLEVFFETNPLDKKCDQRVHITSQPLKIIYDASTINKVIEVFKLPEESSIDELQSAAENRIANMKEKSALGLQYAIDKHIFLDLNIDLSAPYIIVPYGGKYTGYENIIVINLGRVRIYSTERDKSTTVKSLHAQGIKDEAMLEVMLSKSYDEIHLELTAVQLLSAQSDENWKEVIESSKTHDMHILTPINLNIVLFKCVITDDPRLPFNRIKAELPKLHINISDARLMQVLSLITSIPKSEENVPVTKYSSAAIHGSSLALSKYLEMENQAKKKMTEKLIPEESSDTQFTKLDLKFIMSEFLVSLDHQENISSPKKRLIELKLERLECGYIQKTFINRVDICLGTVSLQHFRPEGDIKIISTPNVTAEGGNLFKVNFLQVDKNYDQFHSVYKSCESLLELEFATLAVVLHQEGLVSLIQYSTDIQQQIDEILNPSRDSEMTLRRQLSTYSSEGLSAVTSMVTQNVRRSPKKHRVVVETIKFKLTSQLKEFSVEFCTAEQRLASCAIKGINAEVIMKSAYTQVTANLQDMVVIDLNPDTYHPLILSVIGSEAISAQIVMYDLEKCEVGTNDMNIKATMGGLKIIFLNWFVSKMLSFLNNFQTAQQKIIEASQAAATTAKQNVQDVYQKATKIALDINIKAPDIIVPINSKSYDGVLLDLGHITLMNKFMQLDVKDKEGNFGVIDDLKITLTQFKLARIKLNQDSNIERSACLLEPITFKLAVKRNLSTSWYKAIPDIDISGSLQHIELQLSQADYQMIMRTLNENLSEGQPKDGKQVASTQTENESLEGKSKSTAGPLDTSDLDTTKTDLEPVVHTFMRFTFSMDKFIIRLYTGGSESLSGNTPVHSADNGLGQFSLEGLSIKGRILSDNSIVTSVLLLNCLLDDTRKGREDKLNRLLERKYEACELEATNLPESKEVLQQPKSMLDVTFQMKDDNMFADVRIYSFTFILSVEYLKRISEFFTNLPEAEATKAVFPKQDESGSKVVIKSKTELTKETESKSQMTINLKIEKPDIMLVEHMDNLDTKALLMNCQMIMKVRLSGKHQVINGSLNDLEIFTCCYDPAKRAETKCDVFHPVTISIAGSTPENQGLHVEVLVTPLRLSVTPGIIELMSSILSSLGDKTGGSAGDTEELVNREDLWLEKPYNDDDFWFLKADVAAEATEDLESVKVPSSAVVLSVETMQELCIVSVPAIVISIEAGVGNKTKPMLLLDSSFKGNVRNWSSQMNVDASLTLQMGYYNSALALWEPLIEPVEIDKEKSVFTPWELRLEVSMNDVDQESMNSPTEEEQTIQPPVMSIDVISENNLELTVTKQFLEVVGELTKAFASAMDLELAKYTDHKSNYQLMNETGESITLLLTKGSFNLHETPDLEDVVLEPSTQVDLQLKACHTDSKLLVGNAELNASEIKKYSLHIQMQIEGKNCVLEIPVVRADKRFFMLNYRGDTKDSWGIISHVKIDGGVTIITIRSIVQVYNHFSIPVEVYYMTVSGNELRSITTIEPGGVINIPLKAVYTPTKELFFSVDGYTVTTIPYIWKDLQTDLSITKLLQCTPKTKEFGFEPFFIKAVGEMEQVYYENTSRHTMASTCYNIHLRPAVTLKNLLPISIICCVENMLVEHTVEAGATLELPHIEPGKTCLVIRLPDYLEKEWSCRYEMTAHAPEFTVLTFNSYDSAAKMSLDLGLHTVDKAGSTFISLYCPFWMLNKTGLLLAYRKSKKLEKQESTSSPAKNSDDSSLNILHHPPHFKGPILFSFNAKNFFGKKKAAIRVESGEWSDKFSLDVAGSSGVVTCKANNRIYQIGVNNQITYNGFTKQVTFTPYYVIINNASFIIECQENDRPGDPWIKVEPKSCTALWPHSDLDDKLLRIRVFETTEVSAPFLYTESHTTLLKLNNKYGGINVDIQITEGAFYINLAQYDEGMAPALIINHTRDTMNYWEKQSVQMRHIRPKHCVLYTWENPSGPRVLVWEGANRKELENDLRKDGVDQYKIAEDYTVYWVSFLYSMQRVLLFTEDRLVAEDAQSAKNFELIQQEITVSFHGLGLSLVNNEKRHEVMYVGIASSGIIWETAKTNGRRYKQMSSKDNMNMEAAYQRYLLKVEQDASNENLGREIVDGKIDVDFKLGLMYKPHKRLIRRTFQTGLWLQMKTSPTQLQLHAKINRLQIDNQMFDCTFPIVLAPIPPPKSVAVDQAIKPFAELSIVQLLVKNSQIKQFKYFKVLIQEFHVKVDLGFINAILETIQTSDKTDEEERELFLKDMQLVDEELYSHVSTHSIQEQKSFYDLLHFSPLKIHVSFSMVSGSGSATDQNTPNFLNVLLQSIGVTLTDMNDVVFKLGYFEREYTFLTQRQLISETTSHYTGQLIKQFYVLVFGLDVLGNPYGLVLGITKGVEDLFYEPFQGAIQGPGDFAEGLVLGVRSLFGHTVGGTAGAVSRITGAVGKGLAALTFDKDYQRKRRDQLNRRPATVQEGFARSGKGLVMGVVDGVTGVFTKPISGAKEEGVEGFFKGLGKGAVGLVARPAAGVIDFTSGSFDAVKRVTEVGEDTSKKLRPPRVIGADGLVKPYMRLEAEGNKLLMDLDKGKFATTDIYVAHYTIIQKKEILLLTDKRIAYVTHNDIFGGWQVDWSYTWTELQYPAKVVPKGVSIPISDTKKKKLGIFGSSEVTKTILISDAAKKEEICEKIESLRGSE